MPKLTSVSPSVNCYILSILILCLPFCARCQDPAQEQEILLKLKQFWQNPPLISHWIGSPSNSTAHCSWPEVACSINSVTGLHLNTMDITGAMPPFICDLKNLLVLDVGNNNIEAEFPTFLYNCFELQYLDLSQNYFSGAIPSDIDRMAKLQHMDLSGNSFAFDIPASIGKLKELRVLKLEMNEYNVSYPVEIGNLTNLEVLKLGLNDKFVPSKLPSQFAKLTKLKTFDMRVANLIGGIPDWIGKFQSLEYLDLSTNNLGGSIPSSLFLLKNLTTVYLTGSNLTGEIPQVVESLKLRIVDLSNNSLTGSIPDDFGKLENLTALVLIFNHLSGEIPESIGRLSALTDVRLFDNNLTGVLPPDIGRYSELSRLEVCNNNFIGSLPQYLCNGGKLLGLVVFNNSLSGELPESLGNCSSLLVALLNKNEFTGKIPEGLWKSLNMSKLLISDNKFTGELPREVSWNLTIIEMQNNKFYGNIPSTVSSWKNVQKFQASNNLFNGTIPKELTDLPQLESLLLDNNQLSGSLPTEILSWKSLNKLNLSLNQLSGPIPSELGNLSSLTDLDLSSNQLSGPIPSELGLLKLNFLNLSSNHLTGSIPSKLDIAAYFKSFLNNSGLCTTNPSASLPTCNLKSPKPRKIAKEHLVWIVIVTVAASVSALMCALLATNFYRKKKHELDSTWKLTPFQKLSFRESNILSGLTENNLVGSGGSGKVYRVAVNRSGELVAVKRICNNRKLDQKLEKQFLAEVEILGNIRHLNIVKLLCCISSESSKLLVYEYMENSSLDRWLHRKKKRSSLLGTTRDALKWPQRLQIAIGAAKGLCYMHHDCSPPIVHRDLKSSNILLDSEFNAKIADFGLAKILLKQGQAATMTSVAGSFGYIAPEYAQTTRVNEKIDVYSFGVILLELATGREANDGDEDTCLAEWAWQHILENIPIEDALDEEIKEPCFLDEMTRVFKLGVVCTSTSPSARPMMKEVLHILQKYSPPSIRVEKPAATDKDAASAAPLLKNSRREAELDSDDCSLSSSSL